MTTVEVNHHPVCYMMKQETVVGENDMKVETASTKRNLSYGTNGVLGMIIERLHREAFPVLQRNSGQNLKFVIRRIGASVSQAEVENLLGDEWKCGAGKVDGFRYCPGKLARDSTTSSRAGRAYIRLTDTAYFGALAAKVQIAFRDSRYCWNDPPVNLPPILEAAPFKKFGIGKQRSDARQGLIDQDADFRAFLESLVCDSPKAPPVDSLQANATAVKTEKVTTTPLIEHLRQKRAAKEAAKDAGKTKAKGNGLEFRSSRGDSKDVRNHKARNRDRRPKISGSRAAGSTLRDGEILMSTGKANVHDGKTVKTGRGMIDSKHAGGVQQVTTSTTTSGSKASGNGMINGPNERFGGTISKMDGASGKRRNRGRERRSRKGGKDCKGEDGEGGKSKLEENRSKGTGTEETRN